MRFQLIKILLLSLFFISQSSFAQNPLSTKRIDPQANSKADALYNQAHRAYSNGNYEKAIKLYKESYEYEPASDTANNLGAAYEASKDYNHAIKWYKKAFEMGKSGGGVNLGLLYKNKLNNIPNAVKWYQKAFGKGNIEGAYNLGYLYDVKKHDLQNAIIWYKKAALQGHKKAINNLGEVYHDLHDNITASAYILAGISYGYNKKETFKYLREAWKITDTELREAYKLQQTLGLPKYYTGGID